MELSAYTGVNVHHHTLSSSYIYMRMLYMIHIMYDIYVSRSLRPFLCVLSSLLLPNRNAFSQPIPLLSWTEGATMRPMLGMFF